MQEIIYIFICLILYKKQAIDKIQKHAKLIFRESRDAIGKVETLR